jgi:predicted transcriptional regulator
MEDKTGLKLNEWIKCLECNEPMHRVTRGHVENKHHMTLDEYKVKFPSAPTVSELTAFRIGTPHRGKIVSNATRKKQSDAKTGEKNHFYGKERPEHSEYMKDHNAMFDPVKSAKHKEWANSEENKERVRNQVDENGIPLGSLGGQKAAELGVGGPKSTLKGQYQSIKTGIWEAFASSYELMWMDVLDHDPKVITWYKSHKIRVRYHDPDHVYKNGNKAKIRTHTPDFLVTLDDGTQRIDETKGWIRDDHDRFKIELARKWSEDNGYQFLLLCDTHLLPNSSVKKARVDELLNSSRVRNHNRGEKEESPDDYVICAICGEKQKQIKGKHLSSNKHPEGMTLSKYKELYPEAQIISTNTQKSMSEATTGRKITERNIQPNVVVDEETIAILRKKAAKNV